jgi:hypothetical protein
MGALISGLVDFDLQPGSGKTLTQQIYQQLRARPSWPDRCRRVIVCRPAAISRVS